MKVRLLIADDEPALAEYLRERIAAILPEAEILPLAHNGPEALRALEEEDPDAAFLDIRMPGISGLEVARRAGENTEIVFVTAYDQYAVEAFEREAVDYLLKPVTDERLQQSIERLKKRLAKPAPAGELQETLARLAALMPELGGGREHAGFLRWIRAAVGSQVRLIAVEDVCYFQSADKYTSVFTADGEVLVRTALKELVDQLDPALFWQIHRGTVVNAAQVAGTARDLRGRVVVKLKKRSDTLVVSRAYLHLFRQM